MKRADLVFRGVITEYRYRNDDDKVAVFQVDRVWKGQAGTMVEVSTFPGYSDAPCYFGSTELWREGSDLLVFVHIDKERHEFVNYWSGTKSAKDSHYLVQLGPGRPPHRSN